MPQSTRHTENYEACVAQNGKPYNNDASKHNAWSLSARSYHDVISYRFQFRPYRTRLAETNNVSVYEYFRRSLTHRFLMAMDSSEER